MLLVANAKTFFPFLKTPFFYSVVMLLTTLYLFVFVISRFASLHFDDVLAATQVIEHKDQYHIHNQFLTISYKLLASTNPEIDPDGQS